MSRCEPRSHRRRHDGRPRHRIRIPADFCPRTTKIAYDSELDAAGHVARLMQRNPAGGSVHAYPCPHARHWHVGHG